MTRAVQRLAEQVHPGFPVTIYYAFKQSETKGDGGTVSTGWETFLDALIRSGFAVTGTWPMRTELTNRLRGMDSNALASSIVLVCRQRSADSPLTTRREFVASLKSELSMALVHLQRGNIAPVDLAQAAIGPGMAVYTRYAKVLDAYGEPVPVRDALVLINQTLDEVLAEQEGDFDTDTRWAVAWFVQFGFDSGDYGVAETLSTAKNTSVAGMVEAGNSGVAVRQCSPVSARGTAPRLGSHHGPTAYRVGDGPPLGPNFGIRRRKRCGPVGRRAWRRSRDRSRAVLPPLHTLRTQQTRGRGTVVQRPGAELAGNRSPGTRRAESRSRTSCPLRRRGELKIGR